VHGACPHDCPDACSMLVTVEAGRVVGVRGDPAHPFTRGSLCAKVNDYEARVHHPDRVLHPMRRVGAKGEGRFERISWAEAVDEICGRFRSISAEFGSQAILPYSYAGNMALLNGIPAGDPFVHRLGASILERTVCGSCQSSALVATVGPAFIDPESIVHSRYILIWGANVLSSNQHLWPFIREARRRGAKIVVVDAYRTRTAAQADWFVPIRPGTDGALALGLINVVIAEGLVDKDYVADHTTGFDQLAERAAAFPPERVTGLTGVGVDDIQTLAREFATTQPSVIRTGIAPERSAQGGQAYRAIFSLPALVGSWRHVGGGIQQMPVWGFPVRWDVLTRPEWIRPGTRVVNMMQLGRALTGGLGLDPPVEALLVYNANPAIAAPEQGLVSVGLARADLFTVVHDLFVTDTARYADILLPATTVVEHFDLTWSYGHLYLNVNVPAIEPRGEAVSNTELFRRLAAGMGFTDDWFGLTDEAMAEAAIDWSSPAAAGLSLDRLKEDGWARLAFPAPDVWAPHADGAFPTPSGRVEFVSSLLAGGAGPLVLPLFREGAPADTVGADVDPVPDYAEPAPADYALTLISPKAHAFLNSTYANQTRQRRIEGPQPVLMNPADAAARGVADGQAVRVFNDGGGFQGVADLTKDVVAGAVVCPHGRWNDNGAATINATVTAELTDLGNGPRLSDVPVEVERADRDDDGRSSLRTGRPSSSG
jgi:anaerobic selenocysteine-containing dehydrogenase